MRVSKFPVAVSTLFKPLPMIDPTATFSARTFSKFSSVSRRPPEKNKPFWLRSMECSTNRSVV